MNGSTDTTADIWLKLKAKDKHVLNVMECDNGHYVVSFILPREPVQDGRSVGICKGLLGKRLDRFVTSYVRKYIVKYLIAKIYKLRGMGYRVIASGVDLEPALMIPGLDVPMIEISTQPPMREMKTTSIEYWRAA